jgi:chromosomal replication initiator protein
MTLARFVATPENRSGLMAVQRVATCLGSRRAKRATNPLYLHGMPGTGKTHLVTGLVEEVTRRSPDLVVTMIAASECRANWAVSSAREVDNCLVTDARQGDLVVVEDLQYLPASSAEFFVQLTDDMVAHQVQLVVTASKGPRQLGFSSRLASRLAGGLVVGLEPLAPAGRLLFLQDKAQRRQMPVSQEVLAWLANHLGGGGGRQLEGALNQLEALLQTHRLPLDVALVARQFRDLSGAAEPTVERIARRVSGHYHLEHRRLQSSRRSRNVLLPRQVSMYLARRLTRLSLDQIGAYFGGRDHATVLHACRKIKKAMGTDAVLAGTIRQLQLDLV